MIVESGVATRARAVVTSHVVHVGTSDDSPPTGGVLGQVVAQAVGHPLAVDPLDAVGEGTGNSRDLDDYDTHYVHLFAWDSRRHAIVGAYRLGHVDEIVANQGHRGLYTRSLFSYGDRFIRAIGCALELGRSFIVPEQQRNFGALLLLWRGIAQYVARHPRYHVLLGPVSGTTWCHVLPPSKERTWSKTLVRRSVSKPSNTT